MADSTFTPATYPALFAVITPTGTPRAVIKGRDAALRVQTYLTKADGFLHTIRPARDEDLRPEVFSNL